MPLSIIIPTKNEDRNIITLLTSLLDQDFDWTGSQIIIADADSTDTTRILAEKFCKHYKLPLTIVQGGLPAFARNNGAKHATTELLVFIDADTIIADTKMIGKTVELFENPNVDLATCNLRCKENLRADAMFKSFNFIQVISKFKKPIASTMYFAIRKDVFWKLGGFDEKAKHCEDVLLSREVDRKKFEILPYALLTYPRRFEKTGYLNYVLYCVHNIININDREYFYKDIGYWN